MRRLDQTDFVYGAIDGPIYGIENFADLEQLKPRLRKLIPQRMLDLWSRFPSSFEELAERSRLPALSSWLRLAAGSKAMLTVYDPRRYSGAEPLALLELDFGLRPTAEERKRWVVLVDCLVGAPPHCPRALLEVYRLLGGIHTQYGMSGYLLSPHEVGSLRDDPSCEYFLDMGLSDDPDPWYPYFDADGDVLCYHRSDGRSRWFGREWCSGEQPVRSTASFVEAMFSAFSAKERFHAHG